MGSEVDERIHGGRAAKGRTSGVPHRDVCWPTGRIMSDFVVQRHLGILIGAGEIKRDGGVIIKDIMPGIH